MTRREGFHREVADFHALDFLDGMAGLEQPVAQGVAAGFGKRHFIPRRVFSFDAIDLRASGARQAFDFLKGEQSFELQLIRLWQLVGFQHQIRKLAVVREEDEPHRVIFQTAHREHSLRHAVEKIGESTASLGINHGRDHFRRFIQQQVDALGLRPQEFALHLDVVGGLIGFAAKLGDGLAVHGHEAGLDEFLRMSPRSNAGTRDYFLQSFEHDFAGCPGRALTA